MIGLIFLVLLLITGFLISRLFFKKESFESQLVFGAVLIFCLLIVSVFVLNVLKISSWAIRFIVFGVLIALILNSKALLSAKKFDKRTVYLLIPLAILGILVYYPHFTYGYPLHADEWHHLAFANKIIETGHLFTDPYEGFRVVHEESGFHSFLAGFFLFTGFNPLRDYTFLPALMAMLMGLALFVFIRQITGSALAGVFGMLFYGLLKSDTGIFGPMVLTPFMFALFFGVVVFISLFRWAETKDNRYIYAVIILLAFMLSIHASLAVFTLLLVIVVLIVERVPLKKFVPHVTALLILLLAFLLLAFRQKSSSEMLQYLKSKFFFSALSPMTSGELFSYVSLPLILLAIFGLAYLWDKRKFPLFFASCIVIFYSFLAYRLSSTYIIRPERLFMLAFVFVVILGALGLAYLFELSPVRAHWPILVIALAISSYFQAQGLSSSDFHHYIIDQDYDAILWLKQNYHDKRILSHPFFGNAVPFSGNYAVSYSRLATSMPKTESETLELFNNAKDCEELKDFVNNSRADLVFSKKEFDCPFLEKVYEKNGFVYEIKPIPLKKAD